MIVSMTGYGQGEASDRNASVTVEVRSVNHRFLDFSIKLPRNLQHKERDVKERVKKKLARGRVYISVSVESETQGQSVKLNTDAMGKYLEQLREFAGKHGLQSDIDVNALIQLPDVVANGEKEPDAELLWKLMEKALDGALTACLEMRTEEGTALERDLTTRMTNIDGVVGSIEKLAPGVAKKHAETFRKRVDQLLGDVKLDEDRLTTEIALMADRLDFTEEITRLRSHEAQFNKAISEGGEVSKKLTYLLQEMHREASTIGAKASDSEVIQHVVALKEETEKLREQVQNIE